MYIKKTHILFGLCFTECRSNLGVGFPVFHFEINAIQTGENITFIGFPVRGESISNWHVLSEEKLDGIRECAAARYELNPPAQATSKQVLVPGRRPQSAQ